MNVLLDKQQPTPVYLQLKEMLQDQIEQGVYDSHQRLPSERYLCQHYNLSRMTARRALQELIADGWAYTRAGKGTFVKLSPDLKVQVLSNKVDSPPTLAGYFSTLDLQTELVEQLLSLNCVGVERVLRRIFAHYPLEVVVTNLFPAIIRQFEQLWREGNIGLTIQQYAIMTLRYQLVSMINALTHSEHGAKVLLAGAPGDTHEMGLLALAFCLRQRGFLVTYLGTNITVTDFSYVVETVRPQLICLSAATVPAMKVLEILSQNTYAPTVKFTFGGSIFCQNPTFINNISGAYLGDTIDLAVTTIESYIAK